MTCFPFLGPVQAGKFQFRVGPGPEAEDEGIEVFGGADRVCFAAGGRGTAIGEVCRKAGISEATFYNWRKKYAGLMPSEMKRLRQLEEENGKLKKLVQTNEVAARDPVEDAPHLCSRILGQIGGRSAAARTPVEVET